jgi:hypothetical protein
MPIRNKNDRVELAMKIMKYRSLARRVMHDETAQRINSLIAELEQKLREDRRVTILWERNKPFEVK